jgi:hypothetical protein
MIRAKTALMLAGFAATSLFLGGAAAEEPGAAGSVTVTPIKIAGRRQIPLTITIARVEPKLGVAALRREHYPRVVRASSKEPF